PTGPVTDLDGNVVRDASGNPGFPGFDSMSASTSLGFVADMQEHGIPLTTAYISDAHDNHPSGPAFGPGEAGYVAALKRYDDAFGKFFGRLAKDGITKANTLFTVTADEVEMKDLHMLTGDPARNPTLTLFANPNYFLCAGTFRCSFTGNQVVENPAFAWNHGDIAPDINTTWLGLVGPGVRNLGVDDT